MNQKAFFSLFAIFLLPFACFGRGSEECCEAYCNPTRSALQVRGAAYVSLHQQLREIYGWGLPAMEFEYAYSTLKNLWGRCDEILFWQNAGWTTAVGESIGFGYFSKLNMLPISLGFSYKLHIGKGVDFYLGGGPAYTFLWIRNYDGFETTYYNNSQFGFRTKTGFTFTFCTNFFIDIFGDYFFTSFKKMNNDPIQNVNTNFSGFFAGGGFGGKF